MPNSLGLVARGFVQRSAQSTILIVQVFILGGIGISAALLSAQTSGIHTAFLAAMLIGLAASIGLMALAFTQAYWERCRHHSELAVVRATFERSVADRTNVLRQAVTEIRRSAGIMHMTINSMVDAVLVLDESGATVISNPAAQHLFGSRSFIGSPNWQEVCRCFQPDGTTPFEAGQNPISRVLRGEDVDNVEFILHYGDNAEAVRLIVNGRAFRDPDGKFSGAVLVYRDVTRLHETERQLRHSQKMEAVGQLTGGIAHDFNNILTVIMGTIGIISDKVADQPNLAAITRMIDDAAERGAELSRQLLAFARKTPLQPRTTEVNGLIETAARLLRPTLGERILVETRVAEDCHAFVDPSLLTSALINLAVNGRDAMPNGGHLVIESQNVYLDESCTQQGVEVVPGFYVMIAVSDSGNGIPAAIRDKVFDPFFTTKAQGKGTGLGLSMVYGFVKQSNGHLKLYSEEGYGTTIKIYLPRATGMTVQESVTLVPADAVASGSETVLIVEDDALLRSTLTAQLGHLGYTVLVACDADEALEIVHAGADFDLLLTDLIMPGKMTGRELADAVAEHRPWLKVIFSTGYAECAVTHHCELAPGSVVLPKPYRKDELARTVRMALERGVFPLPAGAEPIGQGSPHDARMM